MKSSFSEPSYGFFYLYVIKCEKDRYYVGVSKNPKQRYEKHCLGEGAKFTRTYKPLKLLKIKPLGKMDYAEAVYYENLCTLLWKKRFGVNKVSGGDYCHIKISKKKVDEKLLLVDNAERKLIILPKIKKKKTKKKKSVCIKKLEVNYVEPKLGKKTGVDGKKALIRKQY